MLSYEGSSPGQQSYLPGSINLFGLQIGRDTSGQFALSLDGLAVLTPAGRYVLKDPDRNRLVDVSPLILTGIDPWVFRIPAERVEPGDLIVTSDTPFSTLYVVESYTDRSPRHIEGLDPATGYIVQYFPPAQLLFLNIFVRVISLFEL